MKKQLEVRRVKAWAIANKSGIGFVTCKSKTILGGRDECRDYILHTSRKNAKRDLDEIYDPTGLKIVEVEIRPLPKGKR